MNIQELISKYKTEVDFFELELLIAYSLGQSREFVLMHSEHKITSYQSSVISKSIKRRIKGEPIAYITGHKEFYGLDFKVNKHTLVPRPETEMMVEEVFGLLRSMLRSKLRNIAVIDIGTGSGCIINSIAYSMEHETSSKEQNNSENDNAVYYATDISREALKVPQQNAKNHGLDKKIKFIHGSLLKPLINCSMFHDPCSMIITANLPYLSEDIYNSAPIDVKKYEPKSALYSAEDGLKHYRLLLEQIKNSSVISHQPTRPGSSVTCLLEISPEQKTPIQKLIKSIFPKAKIEITKDLAGKWRLAKVIIN